MAAYSEEAPDIPAAGADGTHVCQDCGRGLDTPVRWLLHRAANHGVPLPKAIFPLPTGTDQFRQDFRCQWFRINREGVFVEMTEAHVARSVRKLGSDTVIPLLVKGDKIRLKDQTRLRYGEGFDEESEDVDVPSPAKEDIPSYGGGVRGPIGVEMRDDPDEQEQIRRLRERGSHQSAPVTPPKAGPRQKVGRNKASRKVVLEPDNTPPRPPSGSRAEARAAGVEYDAGSASSGGARQEVDPPGQPILFDKTQFYRWGTWVCYFCGGVNPPEADDCFYQPVGGPHTGARCGGKRVTGAWCPDDNIMPWSAPEEWRNTWEATRLQEYEDVITPDLCAADDHVAEVFTSRMREIAERKEAKAERKQAALAAIEASLRIGGWLCPGCNEWNLTFRNLCYRCNGKRTAAGVLSRGIPDPRRHDQDRDESDSDDSAEIELRREQEDALEETVLPFLRSNRRQRGSGSKKRSNPPGGAQGGGQKGKFPKGRGGRGGAAAWLGVGVVASTCRGTGLVRGPVPLRLPPRPVGRAAPPRFAAARRNRSGIVAEPVLAAASYTWALTRRVLNRLAHICTGNISAWAGVAALAAPVLLSIQRGSVGVVDETLAAVAQQSAELVQEVGAEAARTVQVAGRIIALILCAAATWFVARAVLNRLVHALKGNSLPRRAGRDDRR